MNRFWVIEESGLIRSHVGYPCQPGNTAEVWFPAFERSLSAGVECFDGKAEAKDGARVLIPRWIAECEAKIEQLTRAISEAEPTDETCVTMPRQIIAIRQRITTLNERLRLADFEN